MTMTKSSKRADAADAARRSTAIAWIPRLGLYLRPGVDFAALDDEVLEPIDPPRRRKRRR
jgi:hypothetical protein